MALFNRKQRSSLLSTDIDQRSQNLRHLILTWGSNWGYSGFPAIKITMINQLHMCCSLIMKANTHETPHGAQNSWTHFVCVCFCVCGQKKPPNTPNCSSMADYAITRGRIGVLGSLFYICAFIIFFLTRLMNAGGVAKASDLDQHCIWGKLKGDTLFPNQTRELTLFYDCSFSHNI